MSTEIKDGANAHGQLLLVVLFTLGVGTMLYLVTNPGPNARTLPNVLLVSIDTLRRDHLPTYGYGRDTAPNATALARRSIVFEGAIAAHTNTAPAHASVMTGLFPQAHGVLQNGYRLKDDIPTLASVLAAAGYRTAGFVSGFTLKESDTGLGRGFQFYDDAPGVRDRPAADTLRRVLGWIRQPQTGQPVFLFVHLFDPHFPYQAPEVHARRFLPVGKEKFAFPVAADLKRMREQGPMPGEVDEYVARYDGEISYADWALGEILRAWDGLGPSVVVYLADHGETLSERPFVFDHGDRVYDEQIRIPLFLRLQDGAGAGTRVTGPVHQVDVMPTLLSILGLTQALPREREMQGRSLWPALLSGAPLPERPMFSLARPEPDRVTGLLEPMVRSGLVSAVRFGRYKLNAYPTATGHTYELFDLAEDPLEQNNLVQDKPELAEPLRAELEAWRAHAGQDDIPAPTLSAESAAALRALGYLQ
jgi:arylsulfatase A-like enzyme